MTREIVVSLRLSEGNQREAFRALKSALIDVKQEVVENNKALRDNAKAQRENEAALKDGTRSIEQAAVRERELRTEREALKTTAANLAQAEASLGAQYRESRNEVAGLTANGLRFRDVMAQATIEAIKQSGVMGQLSARLDFVRAEQERLNQEQTEGAAASSQLRASLEKLEQEERELVTQSAQLNASLDRLGKEFKEGRISAEQFRAGVSSVNASVSGVGETVTRGVSDLKSYALGFVGVIAVAQGAITAIKSIAATVTDFDQQLANIRALGAEFAGSIDAIAQAAIEMGPKLGVAPVEALKGFEALAKAGLSTEQILGGGLQTVLTLAAAGEVEVGEAAETTAAALTQFGLKGEEAGKVADLLAKGANIAQGNVSDFAAALNQSGLVASQFGLDINETVGGLTAFAKAGLIGSDAGTSFRSALLRLQNPTEKARDVLGQYGIELVNANGEFLGLSEIAGQLSTKLSGLTEEQRGAALATIFGQDAIRVANILYREGAEGIATYTETVNDVGFANEVAQAKLNSVSGSVQKLGAAWDAAVLSFLGGNSGLSGSFKTLLDGLTAIITPAETALEAFEKQSAILLELTTNVDPLLDRYDELKTKTELSASEQRELREIIQRVSETVPLATTAVDDYGNALDISTEKARGFVGVNQSLTAFKNRDALIEQGEVLRRTSQEIRLLTAFERDYQKGAEATGRIVELNGKKYKTTAQGIVEFTEAMSDRSADQERTLTLTEQNAVLNTLNFTQQVTKESLIKTIDEIQTLQGKQTLAQVTGEQKKAEAAKATAEALARLNREYRAAISARQNISAADSEALKTSDALIASLQDQAAQLGVTLTTEAEGIGTVAAARAALAKQLEDTKAARNDLLTTDTQGLAANEALTKSLEKQIAALDGTGKAGKAAAEIINGSVADLRDQIGELQKQQAQSTSSEQFATYQAQIDALTQSVDVLTGKLSQELVDAANAIPERLDTIISTAPLTPAAQVAPDLPTEEQAFAAALSMEQEFHNMSLDELAAYQERRAELVAIFGEEQFAFAEELAQHQLDAELSVLSARVDAVGTAGAAILSVTKEGGVAAKVGLGIQKAAAIASVIINAQIANQAALAAAALAAVTNPVLAALGPAGIAAYAAPTILANNIHAGAAIATILAQALAGFEEGGYTSPGHRKKPAGIVHAGEWVAPQWQVKDKRYAPMIDLLEKERRKRGSGFQFGRVRDSFMQSQGYAGGGTVTDSDYRFVRGGGGITVPVSELNAIATAAELRAFDMQPQVSVTEINRVQQRVEVIEQMSRG